MHQPERDLVNIKKITPSSHAFFFSLSLKALTWLCAIPSELPAIGSWLLGHFSAVLARPTLLRWWRCMSTGKMTEVESCDRSRKLCVFLHGSWCLETWHITSELLPSLLISVPVLAPSCPRCHRLSQLGHSRLWQRHFPCACPVVRHRRGCDLLSVHNC